MTSNDYDQIVASLYRAATGAEPWSVPLQGMQRAFGAVTAVLHTLDLSRGGKLVSLTHGGEDGRLDEAVLNYVREWHTHDPRRNRFLAMGPDAAGRWLHCDEAFDEDFVQRNRFFRHYMLGYGARFNSSIGIPVTDTIVTGLALELPRERGPLNADERQWAQRLSDHVQEALRAHERVRRMAAQALAGHQLLHAFAYPMWLLDGDRFVFHSNPAAQVENDVAGRVALDDGRLRLVGTRAERALTERLQALLGASQGTRALVDLRRTAGDAPQWLHLMLARPDEVLGAFGERPLVLATLFSPEQLRALDPHALAEIFGLTPTQARVAVLMADGLTAAEIGQRLGCAISTVRTHVRQVLARLGARRLADAVRLLRQGEALWARPAAAA